MEEIDQFSDVPLYRQLATILRGRIEAGELVRLQPLPSESSLQQEFGLSRDTVRAAIAALREEGLVFTIPQRGSYVGPRP
jgi:GntR family transcriptional regulator